SSTGATFAVALPVSGTEGFLLAFSCKRRYFCTSCHQKSRTGSPPKSSGPPVRRHHPQNARRFLQARPQATWPPEPVLLPDTQTVPPGSVPRETSRFHPYLHCLPEQRVK